MIADDVERESKRQGIEIGGKPAAKKLLSAVGAVKGTDPESTRVESPRSVQAGVFTKPDELIRNKRVFGALMGHLGKAKKNLEVDARIEKQSSLNSAASEKNRMESQRVWQALRQKEQAERDREAMIREQIDIKQQQVDLKQVSSSWKAKHSQFRKFLQTQSAPQILWLPARHCEKTTDMLKTRDAETTALLEKKDAEDAQELKRLQDRLDYLVKTTAEMAASSPRLGDRSEDSFSNQTAVESDHLKAMEDGEEKETARSSAVREVKQAGLRSAVAGQRRIILTNSDAGTSSEHSRRSKGSSSRRHKDNNEGGSNDRSGAHATATPIAGVDDDEEEEEEGVGAEDLLAALDG